MLEYSQHEFFIDNIENVKNDIKNKKIVQNCEIVINDTLCKILLYKTRFTLISPTKNYFIKFN